MLTFVNKGTWLVKNGQKSAHVIYECPLIHRAKHNLKLQLSILLITNYANFSLGYIASLPIKLLIFFYDQSME